MILSAHYLSVELCLSDSAMLRSLERVLFARLHILVQLQCGYLGQGHCVQALNLDGAALVSKRNQAVYLDSVLDLEQSQAVYLDGVALNSQWILASHLKWVF